MQCCEFAVKGSDLFNTFLITAKWSDFFNDFKIKLKSVKQITLLRGKVHLRLFCVDAPMPCPFLVLSVLMFCVALDQLCPDTKKPFDKIQNLKLQ